MAQISWNSPKEFEVGIDRGVLYNGALQGFPWNGLISVDVLPESSDVTSYYQDGIKFYDDRRPSETKFKLEAYTFPDEFLKYDGVSELVSGFSVSSQVVSETFNLCYRSRIYEGNQAKPIGYKLHFCYNLTATPTNHNYTTTQEEPQLKPFEWELSGVPVFLPNTRPSCYFFIDSTKIDAGALLLIESILYGEGGAEARLLHPSEIFDIIALKPTFIDNLDGTWTVSGTSDYFVDSNEGAFTVQKIPTTWLSDREYVIPES